jgi:dCMP deaminase
MSWDNYFMRMAKDAATRATCDRASVGAVIVDPEDHQTLVTGYNGAPRKLPHCDEEGHLLINNHCVRVVHAEINAICQAARRGIALKGATLYIAGYFPCLNCMKAIIQAGIKKVVYEKEFHSPEYEIEFNIAKSFAEKSGIELICLNPQKRD